MPSPPPFPYKTAPDGEVPPLPAATIVQQPVMSIVYPFGCGETSAVLMLDTMPVMSREPQILPDLPGGGYSYAHFMEYLVMGIAPSGGAPGNGWAGLGANQWTLYIDGVAYGGATINLYDGTPGPIGYQIDPFISPGPFDWTVSHTFQLRATYHDRPGYSEFFMNPPDVGIIAFGPSTDPADPDVPYILEGVRYGCDGRSPAFFPSIFWGDLGYFDPWVSAHHGVGDVSGPVDRGGNYVGLTGPWGSGVPKQHLASPPGYVPCTGSPGGSGDVYAVSLLDFVDAADYAEVTYAIASTTQTLPPCVTGGNPVFDVTRSHKAHH